MAMIALRVLGEAARQLSAIEVPNKEPEDELHVTLAYLGDTVPVEQLSRTMGAVFQIAQGTPSFSLQVDRISAFPPGSDGHPLICPVNSARLSAFRAKIVGALDEAEVEYSKKFKIYRPHVTLGYTPEESVAEELKGTTFPPVSWSVEGVTVFCDDHGSGPKALTVTFPFGAASRVGQYRTLVKMAQVLRKEGDR